LLLRMRSALMAAKLRALRIQQSQSLAA
jgi:hypothetical protein